MKLQKFPLEYNIYPYLCWSMWENLGHTAVQLVGELRYKLKGHGFEISKEVTGFFKLTQSFQPNYGPGVDSASNKYE
jgi:hypothetical protein